MKSFVVLAAGVLLALGFLGAGCGSKEKSSQGTASQQEPSSSGLVGEVGPGFAIEVKQGGADLETIKAGTYQIKVEDKSASHNFHLMGPGVDKMTEVPFEGDANWTITLQKGTYTYQCDPHHASGMKGTFTVT